MASRESYEPDPTLPEGWDFQDELYFTLVPFLGGMGWEDFQNFPIPRLYRFIERLNYKGQSKDEVLSLRELEMARNLSRLFGSKED